MKFSTRLTILSCLLFPPLFTNAQSGNSVVVDPRSEVTYRVSVRADQQLSLFARVSTSSTAKTASGRWLSGNLPVILPVATTSSTGEAKKIHPGVTIAWMPGFKGGKNKGYGYLKISTITPEGAKLQSKTTKVKLDPRGGELRIDMVHPNAGEVEITVGNTGKTPMKVEDLHMNATGNSKTIKRSDSEIAYFTMPDGQPDGDCSSWWSACGCWTTCDPYNTGGTFGVPVIIVGSGSGSGSGSTGGSTGGSSGGTGGTGGGCGCSGGGNDGSDGGTSTAIDEVPEKQAKSFISRKFNCSSSVPLYVNVGTSPASDKMGWSVTPDGDYYNTFSQTGALAFVSASATVTGALIGMTINISPGVSANFSDCEKFVIYGHEMIHVMHYNEHWADAKANKDQFGRCTEYAAYKWTLDAIAAAPCTSDLLTQIKNTANGKLADANETQNCNWNYNYDCIPKR